MFKDTRNCIGERVGEDIYNWTMYHMSAASSICEENLHKQLGCFSMMNLLDSVCILCYQLTLLVRVI